MTTTTHSARDVFGILGTTQVEHFRVERVVAEGGFAVVYRAYHTVFRSAVALKCLKIPGTLDQTQQRQFLESFREEAELLFRLSAATSTVVRPLQVGTLKSSTAKFAPFIALEWLDGQTLQAWLQRRAGEGKPPWNLSKAIKTLMPVARALSKAHSFPAGKSTIAIVHRDLKPENVFIARQHDQPKIKILDYGIAKVRSSAQQIAGARSAVSNGLTAFTPAYAAPEQWMPRRFGQTGPWTDVWGLALTLVECLLGHPALEGDEAELMGAALDPHRRPTPGTLGAAMAPRVEEVFQRALAVDPRHRFASVAQFWKALEQAASTQNDLDRVREQRMQEAVPLSQPLSGAGLLDLEAALASRAGEGSSLAASPSQFHLQYASFERRASGLADAPRFSLTPRYSFRAARARLGLNLPIAMMALGIGLTAGDWAFAQIVGQGFSVGPVRAVWLTGPIVVAGLVLLISRIARASE